MSGVPDYYKPDTQLTLLLGKLDTNLTSLAAIIAKLSGTLITDAVEAGNLIDAIDALDGTMDGRLTLSELNASNIESHTEDAIFLNYYKATTSPATIYDLGSGATYVRYFKASVHPAATDSVVFKLIVGEVTKQTFTIQPGSVYSYWEYTSDDYWQKMTVESTSGIQYYQYFDPIGVF